VQIAPHNVRIRSFRIVQLFASSGAIIPTTAAVSGKECQMVAQSADHTYELLYNASRGLASGAGTLAERLRYAYSDGLVQLQDATLPWPDLTEELRDLMDYFGYNQKDQRPIMDGLSTADQRQVALDVFDLFVKVFHRVRRN
jgi:hypothetical protein